MSEPPTQPSAILQTVGRYYAERLQEFGATPRGVDWNSADGQELRFERLLQLLADEPANASLLDVGCGYGALLDTMRTRGLTNEYRGFDISAEMIAAATARHAADARCAFTTDSAALRPADFAVASGIFNVKLHHPVAAWRDYVLETLASLDAAGTRGFAFNMLSTYSDPERRRDTLYYADPLEMFDLCKRRYSPRVALLHDYPLYEFTVVVRK
ncbi:MAG TPA: methyltransferase domain-containing protein [Vicinamibacterales bacterium]|nr:methyltransferase domain-containing protein [Vicinamibacterales bacterium]